MEHDVTPAPAAPAQPAPAAPTTQSAVDAAIVSGSTSDYRAARRAERAGTPLAAVPVAKTEPVAPAQPAAVEPTEPAQPAAPAQPEAKKLRVTQDYINDRIRTAVDEALRAERARAAAPRTEPAAPAQPTAADMPLWKQIAKLPDAPKMNDVDAAGQPLYESVEEHAAAMSLFVSQKLAEQHETRTAHQDVESAHRARIDSFFQRLEAAKAADPAFVSKLSTEVRTLKPISGLSPDEQRNAGPLNVLWELVYDSPVMDKLLLHFSGTPDALRAFEQMPEAIQKLPARVRTAAHIRRIYQQFGALEAQLETPSAPATPVKEPKTLTDAPAPPQTLGTRPAAAADPRAQAIRSGDTRAYRELRRKERAAGKR